MALLDQFGVAHGAATISAEANDRTLFDCYRTFEGDLQGELHRSSAGSTLKATLVATRGPLNDAAPTMR